MVVLLILLLQSQKIAEDVKRKREQYVNYNILPLYTVGVKPAVMELPEVVNVALYETFLCLFKFNFMKYYYSRVYCLIH